MIRFLIHPAGSKGDKAAAVADDDAAEGQGGERGKKKEKSRGQNTNRNFGASRDEVGLCSSRANSSEFSPGQCRFGDSCKFEHDLRKYLKDWKREDLTTFGGVCPIWYVHFRPNYTYSISSPCCKPCFRRKRLCLIPLKLSHHMGFFFGEVLLQEQKTLFASSKPSQNGVLP